MANSAGISNSFKSEIMSGIHALGTTVVRGATTADTVKAALYLTTATIDATATVYTTTGEVSSAGTGYTAGGVTVTNATAPSTSSAVGIWTPSASIVYTTVTLSATDCVLLYNSTQSNKTIGAFTFGAQTPTAATLTLTMPSNTSAAALVRIA
jgi:hypothetical protein